MRKCMQNILQNANAGLAPHLLKAAIPGLQSSPSPGLWFVKASLTALGNSPFCNKIQPSRDFP